MNMIFYFLLLFPLYIFVYLPVSTYFSEYGINFDFSNDDDYPSASSQMSEPVTWDPAIYAVNDGRKLNCPEHSYKTHVVRMEPMIVYIEGFLSEYESNHIIAQAESRFSMSAVRNEDGTPLVDPSIRKSDVAGLDRDTIVRCIEARALAFQGWKSGLVLEKLKLQRYGVGGHYSHHYDWSGVPSEKIDRVTSFMVYVDGSEDLRGGGTEFPRVKMDYGGMGKEWCEFVECGAASGKVAQNATDEKGVVFKPIKGNAVFWQNVKENGNGFAHTFHAGLPVEQGTKIGLNIWTWYQYR